MYNFSIYIPDGIAEKFQDKLKTANKLCIYNIETDDVFDNIPLYAMNGEQAEAIRSLCIDHMTRIVLISTSLDVNDREKINLLFRRAMQLNVKGIRITPKPDDDLTYIRKVAKAYSIKLYIENKASSHIKDENVMLDYVSDNDVTRLIFNPLEIVYTQRHPFFHSYYSSKIKNHIDFLRINDGLYTVNKPIELAKGCAEIKELASIMLARSYDGYFSFTPYLPNMSVADFKECINTFKRHLKNM